MWKEVAAFIRQHQTFLLTTHLNPEGDAIGVQQVVGAIFFSAEDQHFIATVPPDVDGILENVDMRGVEDFNQDTHGILILPRPVAHDL